MGCSQSNPENPTPLPPQHSVYIQRQLEPIEEVPIYNDSCDDSQLKEEEQSKKDVDNRESVYFQQNRSRVEQKKEEKINKPTFIYQPIVMQDLSKSVAIQEEQQQPQEIDQASITDTKTLILALKKHLEKNKYYHQFVAKQYLLQVFAQIQNYSLSRQQQLDILQLFNKFMHEAQEAKDQPSLVSVLVRQYAAKWYRIKQNILEYNKNALILLSYLIRKRQKEPRIFNHCFLQLKFESTFSQSHKILNVVKEMVTIDPGSFCFFTNYLIKCCQSSLNQGNSLRQLEDTLNQKLTSLESQYEPKPLPQKNIKDEAAQKHINKKVIQTADKKTHVTFKEDSDKEMELRRFIIMKMTQASTKSVKLNSFLHKLSTSTTFAFKFQLLELSKESILQIRDKVIDLSFQKYSPQKYEQQTQKQQKYSIQKYVQKQFKELQNQKKQIYNFIDGQIQFKIGYILSGRCYFDSVGQINTCVQKMLKMIEQETTYTLVQIINTLKKNNEVKQITVVFLIEKQRCEVHFVLKFNLANLIIRKYLQEILNSKKFSLITSLHVLNQQLTPSFFRKLSQILNDNLLAKKKNHFGLPATWNAAQTHFKELTRLLQLKIKEVKQYPNLFQQQKQLFITTAKNTPFKLYFVKQLTKLSNNIKYKAAIKQSKALEHNSQLFIQKIEEMHPNFIHKAELANSLEDEDRMSLQEYAQVLKTTALNHISRQRYPKAIQNLLLHIKIIKILSPLQLIPLVQSKKLLSKCQYKQSNFNKTIQLLQQCLQQLQKDPSLILQQIIVKKQIGQIYLEQGNTFKSLQLFNQNIQSLYDAQITDLKLQAELFKKIGIVFIDSGDHDQSLLYLNKSLKNMEKQTGRNSMELIPLLLLIAGVLQVKKQFGPSLEHIQRCVDIVSNLKGDDSFEMVQVLQKQAKMYTIMSRYKQAEQIYTNCLRIIQQKKGKGSDQYGQCSQKLGQIYLIQGNYHLSLKHLFKSLTLKQKTHGKQTSHSVAIIQKIGKNYTHLRNYREQQHYQHKLNNILTKQKANDNYSHMNTYNNIASKSLARGNYQVAKKYYCKSLDILDQLKGKDSFQSVSIHKELGSIYKYQENYKQALKEYEKCLSILEEVKKGRDNVDRADILIQIGHMYYLQEQDQQAQDYYKQTYELCNKFKVKYWVYALCCYRMGLLYDRQIKTQLALEKYKECLPVYEKMYAKEVDQIKNKITRYQKILKDEDEEED